MFVVQPFVALALATLSLSRSVPLAKRTGKDHWWSGLETYDAYHARYVELQCIDKHNTAFFDKCCHPRLKDADISQIPDECLGSADTCDEDDDNDNNDTKSAPAPAPAPSKAPVNVAPAPAPSVSVPDDQPEPKTTSTHKAAPTSKPSNGDDSGSSGGGNIKTGSGMGTYFLQNGVAGACGTVHADSFHVVALDYRTYGNTSQKSKYCGKTIHITNTKNGKTVDAIVGDACPTCESSGSVDLSVGAFLEIATKEEGEVPIKWTMDL